MSTRRTRSGTRLGCDFEPRRLRQTPSRKQHHTRAVEAEQLSEQSEQNAEAGSLYIEKSASPLENENQCGVMFTCYSPPKEIPLSARKNVAPTSNMWEQLAKDHGHSGTTDDYLLKDSDTEVESDKQENTDSRAKVRKPEILVSLLENESTHSSALLMGGSGSKAVCNTKWSESIGKASRQTRMNYPLEAVDPSNTVSSCCNCSPCQGRTSHFFSHCDFQEGDSSGNFLHMNEIPGEPFLVSLSKDKNKELSMVKTFSGTVRVGSALRTLVPHNQPYHEHVKRAVFSSPEETKTMRDGSVVTTDCASINRTDNGQCLGEARVHVKRLDKCLSKEWDQSTDESQAKSQPYQLELGSAKIQNKACDSTLAGASHNAPTQSSFDYKGLFVADSCLQNTSGSNDSQSGSPSDPKTSRPTPHTISQYPLMEEILNDENYGSFSPKTSKGICLHKPLAVYGDDGNQQVKKTVSLLKTSASLTSLPALVSEGTDYESKCVVKRSERIRSKNGVGSLSSVPFHQSVISTMKPADKKNKLKSKAQAMKKKAKMAMCKKTSKSKCKKRMSNSKKSHVDKRPKDFSRAKATMSREVMDAIVQSIEETVSRATPVEQHSDHQDSTSEDVSQSNTDLSSTQDSLPNFTDNSNDSYVVDHWSDSGIVHDEYDANSTEILLTPSDSKVATSFVESVCNKKATKTTKSKRTPSKPKKPGKMSPDPARASLSKGKVSKCKAVMSTDRITTKPLSSIENVVTSTDASVKFAVPGSGADDGMAVLSISSGKRFRKKTRKAEEAFGDYDVFCDEDWPVKKSKAKKRYSGSCSDTSSCTNQRRPRRSSQMGGLMTDPVLEEHAFILWASENRSQLEQQHPGASTCEVDAILSSRWCDVIESVKARFFFRAREAFSDDDRHMIRSSTMAELEAGALGDFFTDRDPVYIEFIRLPRNRQRDLLRKWLKFFQKILPKKEYIDFIITFKRACGREGTTPTGRPKRTRMRCLDPSHYKMLFDMIRLTKPRVLDVYRDKKGKEKKMVSDTYSLMLRKLVNNEPWRHVVPGCRSQMLTEILQDLQISDHEGIGPNTVTTVITDGLPLPTKEEQGIFNYNEDYVRCDEEISGTSTELDNDTEQIGFDLSLGESDYSVLTTDLALSLLSGLNEMADLPVLDQFTLDQVFLAPPRISVIPTPQRRAVSLYNRRLDTPPPHLSPAVGFPPGSPTPHRLMPVDSVPYPKMNIHYPPTTLSCSGMIVHHLPPPPPPSTLLQKKYISREMRDLPPCRSVCCRKDSPMDMHTYSISVENMLHCSDHVDASSGKCMKVYPKIMSPQNKMNPQTQQLPITSRLHPQTKLHPRVVPVSCGFQNRFPSHIFSSGSQNVLDKLSSHHMYHMGSQPSAAPPSSSARLYPQPIGLNSSSPLITSLSPLRNIKYNAHGNKMYSSQCQLAPRMQLAGGTIGHGHRKTAHAIPISTTLKPSAGRSSCNLHQIKVCLPTQALKIPIAKLRCARKTSYVKGKMKNLGLQQNPMEPFSSSSCSQPYQYTVRASSSVNLPTKVLSVQIKNEADQYHKSFTEPSSGNHALCSKPCSSAFYGSSVPVNAHSSYPALKSSSQVQLVSVKNSQNYPTGTKTTQTAVVVSPMAVHRNSFANQPPVSSSTFLPCVCSPTYEPSTETYSVALSTAYARTGSDTDSFNLSELNAKDKSKMTSATDAADEECESITSAFKGSSQPDKASEDEVETQFVVVGTASISAKTSERLSTPPNVKNDSILCRTSNADSLISLFGYESTSNVTEDKKESLSSKAFSPSVVLDKTSFQPPDSKSVYVECDTDKYSVKDPINDKTGRPSFQNLSESAHLPSTLRSSPRCAQAANSLRNVKTDSPLAKTIPPSIFRRETSLLPSSVSSYDTLKSYLNTGAVVHKTLDPPVTNCLSQLLNVGASDTPIDKRRHCLCSTCLTFGSGDIQEGTGSEIPEALQSNPVSNHNKCEDLRSNSTVQDGSVHAGEGSSRHSNETMTTETTACPVHVKSHNFSSENIPLNFMSGSVREKDDVDKMRDLFADQYNPYRLGDSEGSLNSIESKSNIRSALERVDDCYAYQGLKESQNASLDNWSLERSDSLRSVMRYLGPGHESTPGVNSPETSGLQILAETATSARSLLPNRRILRPADQKKCFSEDSSASRKPDLVSHVGHESGTSGAMTKKMTMCSVTVQPDTGCILVESLTPREKTASQFRRTNPIDATMTTSSLSAQHTSTTANTSTASAKSTINASPARIAQSSTCQKLVRTSLMTSAVSQDNVIQSLGNVGQNSPPSLSQSPNSTRKRVLSPNHKKRAHYVHEYLPT